MTDGYLRLCLRGHSTIGEFITNDYFRPVKELYPYQAVVQTLQVKPFRLISFEERQLRCLYV